MPQEDTLGRLLLKDAVPEDLRPLVGALDKKGIGKLYQALADAHPEKYREVSKKLSDIAVKAGYESGGYSFGIEDMQPHPETAALRKAFEDEVARVLADTTLTPKERDAKLVRISAEHSEPIRDSIMQRGLEVKNPLAMQVASGAKGKPDNLKTLVAGDSLYQDQNFNAIPFPITKSFAEGLTPAQYFAGTFGARYAIITTKLSTASGGWLAKRLSNSAHRLLVSDHDGQDKHATTRGFPVALDEPDNEGALLAHPVEGYPRDTVLTRQVITDLKKKGVKEILARSPLVGGPGDGGVYGKDVGIRERGRIAPRGDYVGLAASQSIAEPLTQMLISSKHGGGVAGAAKGQRGFPVLDQLTTIPSTFPGGAVHAQHDGLVTGIREAPQGGRYISVDGKDHYARPELEITAKPGDKVEAGDILTDGIENPAEYVRHKGIGEGRRRFVDVFRRLAADAGFHPHRRNLELVTRGLIDHVHVDKPFGEYVPGDITGYTALEHDYDPRPGSKDAPPKELLGHYLERPVLHHTIGDRIVPSMLPLFEKYGVQSVTAHPEPPPFSPVMVRSQDIVGTDPDWQTRMLGSSTQKTLLRGVHRGDASDPYGTSYAAAMGPGVEFGQKGKTVGWKPEGT